MNRVLCLAAAVLVLGGCSAGSEDESAPTQQPVESSSSSAPSASAVESEASATEDPAEAIRGAAQAYSDAFLTGDGEAAYALLSKRCQDRMVQAEFVGEVESAGDVYGEALPFDTFDAEVNGDQARVTYTYADNAEINQDQEPWVHEDGQWLEDDC